MVRAMHSPQEQGWRTELLTQQWQAMMLLLLLLARLCW